MEQKPRSLTMFLGDRSSRNDVRKIKYCNLCTMYRHACEGPSWMQIFSSYDTFIKLEIEFRIGAKLATMKNLNTNLSDDISSSDHPTICVILFCVCVCSIDTHIHI